MDRINIKETSGEMLFMLGTFILSLFFFSIASTTVLFVMGIQISRINLFIAVACSVVITFLLSGRSAKTAVTVSLIGILLLGITIFLCSRVYDMSYDGNTYHKGITGALKNGWNPLHETFYDFAEDIPFLAVKDDIWYDAYPKGTEIWAACIYIITNNIETGKCFNILSIIALFCICYTVLLQTGLFNKIQSFLAAFFCSIHPLSLAQVTSYYIDGFLWEMLLLCMVSLLYLTFFENGKYHKRCVYLTFISISIGIGIKFSALIFFAILCLCFFGYWVVQKCREAGWRAGKKWIRDRFLLFASAVVCGTVFLGSTSYVINILRHGNPLYTMIGEDSEEMIISQVADVYKDMSHLTRFIVSLFSRTNNSGKTDYIQWKIPFTYNGDEVYQAQKFDTRIAGWGILFSGILLCSLVIIWIARTRLKDKKSKTLSQVVDLATLLLAALFFSICFVPGMFWARYCGALFYIPVAALLYLFAFSNQNKPAMALPSVMIGVLCTTLFLNVVPNVAKNYSDYKKYNKFHTQLVDLKKFSDSRSEPVTVGYGEACFEGRFFALYDMEITNFVFGAVDPESDYGTLFDVSTEIWYSPKAEPVHDISNDEAILDFARTLHDSQGKAILISVKDEGSKALTEEFVEEMRSLGLEFQLAFQSSYVAVLADGDILNEEVSAEEINYQTQISGVQFELTSGGYYNGNIASIKINGYEYAINRRGLNMVIYDLVNNEVIDSLCIDTYLDNSIKR